MPAAAGLALVLALGACSADSISNIGSFNLTAPKASPVVKDEFAKRAVTVNDLIGADGYCPGETAPAPAAASPQTLNFTAGPQAGPAQGGPPPQADPNAAPPRTGVSLGMTECEVVRAVGHTDRVEITTNEQGQRSVTLTYAQGERPGIYRFVAGRLVSLERTGEPPAPPKPAKPKKAAKKQPPA
jgi:hypothetical protein